MRYAGCLIVVRELDRSVQFYRRILGLAVELDFGANVTLTGGLSLQTAASWQSFTGFGAGDLIFGHRVSELYFEERDMDGFLSRLSQLPDIDYVHPPWEHSWGQRVVRFYDPDRHIIEVGEDMTAVVRRFIAAGLSPEDTARRMDVPLAYVLARQKIG